MCPLVEEPDDLSCNVLASRLLVVHDTGRSCEDHVSELTGRQELDDPLLEICEADVVSGRDDTGLVEAKIELAPVQRRKTAHSYRPFS